MMVGRRGTGRMKHVIRADGSSLCGLHGPIEKNRPRWREGEEMPAGSFGSDEEHCLICKQRLFPVKRA